MKGTNAPIALFVYNREAHTRTTINALSENFGALESDLFIFSDGPKNNIDIPIVLEIRNYLATISGFKSVQLISKENNIGLANSIKSGISQVLENYDRVIVLEDDIVTSKFFLKYMNESLSKYYSQEQVMEISGYNYPIITDGLKQTFFVRMAACWGWATWSRAWNKYAEDVRVIENEIVGNQLEIFKVSKTHHFWKQIELNKRKKIKTWFIFWYASIFINNGLVLYPKYSLVQNIGFDGSGENCGANLNYNNSIFSKEIIYLEDEIKFNLKAHLLYKQYFEKINPSFVKKVISKLNKLIPENFLILRIKNE